jgi:ATP-dependent DNA helicase RecQ
MATIDTPTRMEAAEEILRERFGLPGFRPGQRQVIEALFDQGGALAVFPTGGGKSLCYQLPALMLDGVTVVISPLIALMKDQIDYLRSRGIEASRLDSSLERDEIRDVERGLRAGTLKILYVAPERFNNERFLQQLGRVSIALFAVDEAHCISQWGHNFRPDYLKLAETARTLGVERILALTATATPAVVEDICDSFGITPQGAVVTGFHRPNLFLSTHPVASGGRSRVLVERIRSRPAGSGIVYVTLQKSAERVAEALSEAGIPARAYHAGMDTDLRTEVQEWWKGSDRATVVATIAFGMGIDKPDVRFVCHLDLPKSIEGYYQETGRAGRDGMPASAWMAYGLQDVVLQRRMIDESEADETFKRVLSMKLDAMLGLCETLSCRRTRLLEYFGEQATPCGNCDTCLIPPVSFDGTVPVQKLLSAIYRVDQRFAAGHVIDVLRGVESDRIKQWHHDSLSVFGIGAERAEAEWRAILRQTIALGLVTVDHEVYSSLKLTDAARPVLKGGQKVQLRQYQKPVKQKRAPAAKGHVEMDLSKSEQEIFEKLRWWRVETARAHNVPAYVIFVDATLREIAKAKPTSLNALRTVTGVGEKKLVSYGDEIVAIIMDLI